MKKLYSYLPLLALPVIFIFLGYQGGSPGGRTGSPGDNQNNCTACHSGTPQNASNWISSDILGNGYIGGETYTFTATGTHAGVGKFGFELTAEDPGGNKTGTFSIINASETKLANNSASVTHTGQGTTPAGDSKTWDLQWTAPATIPGDITFYAAFNAANGNGATSGDVIYLTQKTYGPDVTRIAENRNEFRFYPNPSTGLINLESGVSNRSTVNIYDQAGRIIKRFEMQGSIGQVDLSTQAKGVYFVQFDNRKMQKLVLR